MRLAEALFSYLSSDPGVSSIVEDRIYPMRLPEKCQIPALSWQRIDAGRIYVYETYEDTTPVVLPRVQFNCWAYTFDEADALGDAVLLALSGYDGDMSGQLIGSSFAINELDTYEPATKFHRRILDFRLSYEEVLAES